MNPERINQSILRGSWQKAQVASLPWRTINDLPQTVNVELEATYRDENFVELKPTSVSLANEGFWGSLVEAAFRENQ